MWSACSHRRGESVGDRRKGPCSDPKSGVYDSETDVPSRANDLRVRRRTDRRRSEEKIRPLSLRTVTTSVIRFFSTLDTAVPVRPTTRSPTSSLFAKNRFGLLLFSKPIRNEIIHRDVTDVFDAIPFAVNNNVRGVSRAHHNFFFTFHLVSFRTPVVSLV